MILPGREGQGTEVCLGCFVGVYRRLPYQCERSVAFPFFECRRRHTIHHIKHNRPLNNMMDVTFVLEESGVTATVEVPCEANVAAAKEVACKALAVSPASVEMRIGTQMLEGTCRLQDTALGAGVQVVLARRFVDIKCPAAYSAVPTGEHMHIDGVSLSHCGALCLFTHMKGGRGITGLDTETFSPAFEFEVDIPAYSGAPAISRCKTRCYLPSFAGMYEVALPGGEVLRNVGGPSAAVVARGGVVASRCIEGVSVYDEDLTLLRSLSHEGCKAMAVSECGDWVITSHNDGKARLWDVNTGVAVACVRADVKHVALSRRADVFAVERSDKVQVYSRNGAALGSFKEEQSRVCAVQLTPSGQYVVVGFESGQLFLEERILHQYDVVTRSCVRMFRGVAPFTLTISPCSRVVVVVNTECDTIETRHLYPSAE